MNSLLQLQLDTDSLLLKCLHLNLMNDSQFSVDGHSRGPTLDLEEEPVKKPSVSLCLQILKLEK